MMIKNCLPYLTLFAYANVLPFGIITRLDNVAAFSTMSACSSI